MLKALLSLIFGKTQSGAMTLESTVNCGPSLSRSYSGFYQPEKDMAKSGIWVADTFTVPMAAHPGDVIRLQGIYYQKAIAKQSGDGKSKLSFFVGLVEVHSAILVTSGDFAVEFTVPDLDDISASSLTIQCSKAFVPNEIGGNEDPRKLSWRIKSLAMGPATILDFAQNRNLTLNDRFAPELPNALDFSDLTIKAFAFYRPQFRFPEVQCIKPTLKAFGWSGVARSIPQSADDHQPQLPIDLGFYDVRSPNVVPDQVALARKYGIAGFCLDFSWPEENRLDNFVLDVILSKSTLKIGVCLTWDCQPKILGENEQLTTVQIGTHESSKFLADPIETMSRAFRDCRYLKVDQKPVLILKGIADLFNLRDTVASLQMAARQIGLPGLYLIAVKSVAKSPDLIDPSEYGFDAILECPPAEYLAASGKSVHALSAEHFSLATNAPGDRAPAMRYEKQEGSSVINSQSLTQNTAIAVSLADANPTEYAYRLVSAVNKAAQRRIDEQFFFIDSWNNWAADTRLEPDQRYGYGYLHATVAALRNKIPSKNALEIASINRSFSKQHDAVIILHIFYEDLIDSIFDDYLCAREHDCDLIVTVLNDASNKAVRQIKQKFDNCFIIEAENRGRDIRPFLIAYRQAHALGYLYACKLHTKKSPQRTNGTSWRTQLLNALLLQGIGIAPALRDLKKEAGLGILAPQGSLHQLSKSETHGRNSVWMDILLARLGVKAQTHNRSFPFPAGSMYWFRIAALARLLDESFVSTKEFEFEAGQLDGTLAHALERIVGLIGILDHYAVRALVASSNNVDDQ